MDASQEIWLLPVQQLGWNESGPKYSRHPTHGFGSVMRFDDVQPAHTYIFCAVIYTYEIVKLHAALSFKSSTGSGPIHKRDISEMSQLKPDTWHFLDDDGEIRELPDHVSEALDAEDRVAVKSDHDTTAAPVQSKS